MKELSHIDEAGRAKMVDVGQKPVQSRIAVAEGSITLKEETLELIHQNLMKKGDVIRIAEIAGIQAAKRTSELIPLCHPLLLTSIGVKAEIKGKGVYVRSQVECSGQTGVEMEALTAVSMALLTIYDMCKAIDKEMIISNISLLEKHKS